MCARSFAGGACSCVRKACLLHIFMRLVVEVRDGTGCSWWELLSDGRVLEPERGSEELRRSGALWVSGCSGDTSRCREPNTRLLEREGCWSHGIRVFTSTGVRWTGVASERSDVAPSAASAASAVLARVFTTAVASLHIVESTGGHCVCVFSHRIFAFSRFFSWELRCCSELVRSGQSPIWDRAPSFLSA